MGLYDEGSGSEAPKTESTNIETPPQNAAPPPKRRGRPPGSKNKATNGNAPTGNVPIDMGALPDEIVEPLALAPLILVRGAIEAKTTERNKRGEIVRKGIALQYDEKAVVASVAAFRKWLSSIDLNLSPGYAYLACMAVAFGSATPMFFSEMQERGRERANGTAKESETSNAAKEQPAGAGNVNGGSASADSPS